jgi:hypothetical protein
MSAASTPAPRTKSSSDSRPAPPRHTLFLPFFILLIGMGVREVYQVMSLEDQLDQMTQNVDKMDPKVKIADYERAKFYFMASEVLRLSAKDPNAAAVSELFGLRKLEADKPELMHANTQMDLPTTNAVPDESAVTNIPPTNAAAPSSSSPATK